MIYKDEFIKDFLFKEHSKFLFPTSYESNTRKEEIFLSLKNIANNCNLTLLLQEILDINLDSNELYSYSYYFISSIFKIYITNKKIREKYKFNKQLLINTIIYVLNNFDKVYHDSQERKIFINIVFQNFLSCLYSISSIKKEENSQEKEISKISSILKELIKNNKYSN